MSKYGNHKIQYDGYTFDSKAEMRRYQELWALQVAGEIYGLGVHPSYELEPKATVGGKKLRAISHELDFSYFEHGNNRLIVEDVKGVETAVWKIKHNLFRRRYPNIEYRVIPAKDC